LGSFAARSAQLFGRQTFPTLEELVLADHLAAPPRQTVHARGRRYLGGISTRQRLDAELVRRGLVTSPQQALQLIDAHKVQVNGAFADNPARLVDRGDSVEILGAGPPFVSRAGEKLAGALDAFDLDPRNLRCLDAGASTGGFTDCLLQRGAAHVIAVDVGYGQLHESLVGDKRVTNRERTNIRHLTLDDIGDPVDLIVGDLSFISLTLVLEGLVALCRPGTPLVLLVKPQFEAGRSEADRGNGVIRDPVVWRRVLGEVTEAADQAGAGVRGAIVSPIRGGQGNVEFLAHLRAGGESIDLDLHALVAAAGEAR
jgi:23S rRNA (cytidine1920-2'-O)/16S rRNA (cytidine1409-2'-O)-methyltransferase